MKRLLLLGATLMLSLANLGAQHPQLSPSARASQLTRNANAKTNNLRATVEPGKGFTYTQKDAKVTLDGGIGNPEAPGSYVATCIKLPKIADGTIKGISFIENGVDNETTAFIGELARIDKEVYDGVTYKMPVIKVVKSIKVKLNHNALSTVILDTPFKMDPQKEYYVGYYSHSGANNLYPVLFDITELPTYKDYNYGLLALTESGKPFDASEGKELKFDPYETMFGAPYIYVDVDAKSGELDRVACITTLKGTNPTFSPKDVVKVDVEVYNFGLRAAKNVVAKVADNGKDEQSFTIPSIEPGKRAKLTVEFTKSTLAGVHLVEGNVPSMDGGKNLFDYAKTNGIYKRVDFEQTPLNKQLLVERFTTERCGYCPGADPRQESFIKLMEKEGFTVSVVAHHSGYGTDFLSLKEDVDIANSLDVDGAPTAALNRYVIGKNGENFDVVGKPEDLKKLALSGYKDGSPMKIESITRTKKDGNKYSYDVKCKLFPGIDPGNTYVTVVAVEDNIESRNQSGAVAGYRHNNVARKYYTNGLGDKLENLTAGDYTYKAEGIVYDDKWDSDNVRLVVFFHGNIKDPISYRRAVYASAQIKMGEEKANYSQKLTKDMQPRAYAHNGYILVEGAVEYYNVYNMVGQLVGNTPTQQYTPGVYVVNSVYGNQSYVTKVVVK